MNPRAALLALGVAVSIVLLPACGSSTTKTAASTAAPSSAAAASGAGNAGAGAGDGPLSVDPCSLLTAAEVTAALGSPGTGTALTDLTGAPKCRWIAGNGAAGIGATISVRLDTADLCKAARQFKASPALKQFQTAIGQGGEFSQGTGEVITSGGCFTVSGSDKGSNPLPEAIVMAAAQAVVSHLG